MEKTLYCNTANSPWDKPHYIKVTAQKVDEVEAKVKNLYKDAEGNYYIAGFSKFAGRQEFTKLDSTDGYIK